MKHLRNIAIIAHVDHGKTTLVDAMLRQSGIFRENQQLTNQVMDSNDLERERGITIMAKNTAIQYGDWRINVVDTPGHADFGGEVERVLKMVDGVLLLVDAADGPMPQTRFVLRKALEMNLVPVVVINKIDRPDARVEEVQDLVLELFIELGATEEQIDFPVLYSSARNGAAFAQMPDYVDEEILRDASIVPLFDAIIERIPEPPGDPELKLQLLISNIDYDSYIGRIAIGRIERGTIKQGQSIILIKSREGKQVRAKASQLLVFNGLARTPVNFASTGEIVCLAGLEEVDIGDTICDPEQVEALPFVHIDDPTIAMEFRVNDSPFAGREGQYVTSRQVRDRLEREMQRNVAMRMEEGESSERFIIKGRGELQLSVLIETMRREGYEFQVSRPQVVTREEDGQITEPEELLLIDVPEGFTGIVIDKLSQRKAELINMLPPVKSYIRMEFRIPSRGLIGYRSEFLTDTRGNGIMHSMISSYVPWKGPIPRRGHGVLIAFEGGESVTYGLYHAQERGDLFLGAGSPVYEGMIVGTTMRGEDIVVNVCKRKQVTNMRASGTDEALRLSPPVLFSLEQCLEFISDDELVEVTPTSIRMRKKILNHSERMRAESKAGG